MDDGIWMGGRIIEKLGARFGGLSSAFGLGGSESAESDKHGGLDGPGVVQECPNDFLEAGFSEESMGGESSGGAENWVLAP
jgi:hypothetical protein